MVDCTFDFRLNFAQDLVRDICRAKQLISLVGRVGSFFNQSLTTISFSLKSFIHFVIVNFLLAIYSAQVVP